MSKILVTGANGQLGTVLTKKLAEKYGEENIIASDLNSANNHQFEILDVTDFNALKKIVLKYKIISI